MIFADLALSKRLERAEGVACVKFVEARRLLYPGSGAEWLECGGTYAAFDGVDSPVTQTFGLGLFEEISEATLDQIESFFADRGAPVLHEVSPLAGVPALDLLCRRKYRPFELSNVLWRRLAETDADQSGAAGGVIRVRVIEPGEGALWADVSARGWTHDHPELKDMMKQLGTLSTAREQSLCFLAECDGVPGAAGVLCIHEGVALLGGSATVPELRRRGLQAALLEERMRYAFHQGCDIAMIVTEPGSNSQRNAERKGFRIAYTRTKWRFGPIG